MARIPFADVSRPETKTLVDRIMVGRGSILQLYSMLLHSPPVAEGWLEFMTAIRQKSMLSGALRELAIMRIASLNDASYEAAQHAPIALKEGLSQQQLDDVHAWYKSHHFDACQRAVLDYVDAMTRDIRVPKETFLAVRKFMDDRQIVELTATIGAYNMVSRFLEALEIRATNASS
jgi:AhpD family alkylhydroperoxidase